MILSTKTIAARKRGRYSMRLGDNTIGLSLLASKLFEPGTKVSFIADGQLRLVIDNKDGFLVAPASKQSGRCAIYSTNLCKQLKSITGNKKTLTIGEFREGYWPLYPSL